MSEQDTGYAPPPPGYAPPPQGSAPPRPPLRRTTGKDNVLAGVSAGIARWLGIDPILVRVAFVILTIFGGSGILLYLAGWLFIPEDGREESPGESFFRNHNALAITAAVVIGVLVVAPMLAWGFWDGGIGFGGIVLLGLVIAAVVALTRRNDPSHPAVAPGLPGPVGAASSESPPSEPAATTHPTAVLPGPQQHQTMTLPVPPDNAPPAPPAPTPTAPPPPPPSPPREKSVLGRLTFSLALVVSGGLVALDLADVIAVSAVTVVATALVIVGLGLLVGAFVGRSRGLIALGVLLTLVLIPMSAVPRGIDWNTGDGAGDRTYVVRTASDLDSDFALGAGKLTLDLRQADVTGDHTIDASVGVGELVVWLPRDADAVDISVEVGVGAVEFPGEAERGGVDVDSTWERPLPADAASDAALTLTLSSGLGKVTVIEPATATLQSNAQESQTNREVNR